MSNPLPPAITAGVTFSQVFTLTAFPAPDWQLKLLLRGPQVINLSAQAEANQYRFQVDALDSKDWLPGNYHYWLRAYRSHEIHELDAGYIKVLINADSINDPLDTRSHEQIVVDNINAILEDRANLKQKSYSINGRSLERYGLDELLKLKTQYEWILKRRQAAQKKGHSLQLGSIHWRFQ